MSLPTGCDVLVVGAGIVGLAHAAAALDAGHRVVVIEREHAPVGASIRNFGHACVTGQSGELLALALVARERWLQMASRSGIFAVESGGLAVARSQDELAVLQQLAAVRPEAVDLLTEQQVRDQLAGHGSPRVVGGLRLALDLRVDPREAVPGMIAWLAEQPRASVLFNTTFLGRDGRRVRTSRGELDAERVIVCVGHDVDHLYGDLAMEHGLQRCRLQMSRLADPGFRISPAVLSGTSLLRYDAFAEMPAAAQVRADLLACHPELLDIDANVMLTQRPDGTVIVGDSHDDALTAEPFMAERTTDILLDDIADLLGVRPPVVERWQGVYAHASTPVLEAELSDDVRVCSVTTGVGMTISFGLAARAFA